MALPGCIHLQLQLLFHNDVFQEVSSNMVGLPLACHPCRQCLCVLGYFAAPHMAEDYHPQGLISGTYWQIRAQISSPLWSPVHLQALGSGAVKAGYLWFNQLGQLCLCIQDKYESILMAVILYATFQQTAPPLGEVVCAPAQLLGIVVYKELLQVYVHSHHSKYLSQHNLKWYT